jgi:hypothetical protein
MNESIDHLYRRTATERSSRATDDIVLSVARAHARSIRWRRRLGMGVTAAAALALLVVYTSRHEETVADDALRAHYAAVAHPYLLAVKLGPGVTANQESRQSTMSDSQ